jgi:4-amino-4-deoxy-L-arabinose transferase-like glycosyltransferase
MTTFAYLEFARTSPDDRAAVGFLGSRPWAVLAFFALFGMTNLAKGLIFGTLMVAVPVGGYLLSTLDLKVIRRYVWLWGWLAFAAAALLWPVAVYRRYPDVVDLWLSDYVGRLNHGYIGEPRWYYLTALPYVMLPWTLPALLGLGLTFKKALGGRYSPERFLWCWAVLTPAFFSIPDGKHHHYLLQCLAPWAVFGALGAVKIWESIPAWPALLRSPLAGLVCIGLGGDAALVGLKDKIPGPGWLLPVVLAAWPALVYGMARAMTQRNGRVAFGSVFALLVATYWGTYAYKSRYANTYAEDLAFLENVRTAAPADRPLFLNFDAERPLETFHMLFYGDRRLRLLRNLTFVLDDRLTDQEVYLLARARDLPELTKYGRTDVVLQSEHSRGETSPSERRTLYRLRFYEHVARKSANVYVSPMQATSRAGGPYLQ